MWRNAVAATLLVVALPTHQAAAEDAGASVPDVPAPGCHFAEVVDGSTAVEAQEKIEAAGFADVRALKKSCDNYWHGQASWDGRPVNVVLSPAGMVMLESD